MTTPAPGTHTQHEDTPWTIDVGDHAARADSPVYTRSRKIMVEIVKTTQPWVFGEPPYQDHHGGGIWVMDDHGWLLVKNVFGMEWSSQFCADPAKVEVARRNAERIVAGFPKTEPALTALGMTDADLKILHTPVTDAATIGDFVDSHWNASVPLPQPIHTGTIPKGAGVHHYPTPITDIMLFKRDDFNLFVVTPSGHSAAVLPVAPHGSGDGRVALAWSEPGSALTAAHETAHANGEQVILPADHDLARQAFTQQKG